MPKKHKSGSARFSGSVSHQFKVTHSKTAAGEDITEKISVRSDGSTSDEASFFSDVEQRRDSAQGEAGEERDTWSGRLDFLLSCIGYAVGLGNVWRFPYLVYDNGGGAFLIPYTFFAVTCAVPLFFLEISFGQFASLSPITIWRISPLFRGLGYAMVLTTLMVTLYYNVIVAYAMYFIYLSCSDPLPWTRCDHPFNTNSCVLAGQEDKANTTIQLISSGKSISASEEYWTHFVLKKSSSIDEPGDMQWPLVLSLFIAWSVVFLCLFKGIKASGKVVYVTALFPYVLLITLLVKGLTLEGASEGIKFYLEPKLDKLLLFSTWKAAANQIFYSMGAAWGVLLTMSSFNKFNNNVFRDTYRVPLINCCTSFFAGFVIFSILGFMAHALNKEVKDVVQSGMNLAFIVYPEAVGLLPGSQAWAVMFFVMILMLGCDSEFTMFECIISSAMDEFPVLRRHKLKVTATMCTASFLLGLPMCTQGGNYVLGIIDTYSASYSVMFIAVCECLVISWIYGVDRFSRDIELMVGKRPGIVWKAFWSVITPLITTGVWLAGLISWQHINYDDDPDEARALKVMYPQWSVVLGLVIGMWSLLPIPLIAIKRIVNEKRGTIWQRIVKLTQPSLQWGPSRDADYKRYLISMTKKELQRWDASRYGLDMGRYYEMKRTESKNKKGSKPMTVADGSVILDLSADVKELKAYREITSPSKLSLPGSRRISEDVNNEAELITSNTQQN